MLLGAGAEGAEGAEGRKGVLLSHEGFCAGVHENKGVTAGNILLLLSSFSVVARERLNSRSDTQLLTCRVNRVAGPFYLVRYYGDYGLGY